MNKEQRTRCCVHDGSEINVLDVLETHGLTSNVLLAELGSDERLDHIEWLREKTMEEQEQQER